MILTYDIFHVFRSPFQTNVTFLKWEISLVSNVLIMLMAKKTKQNKKQNEGQECPYGHSVKKWGILDAPCQKMLVFGGKFWNLEGNCGF